MSTPSASRTSIVPPPGLNFTALSRMLTTARSSEDGSARTYHGSTSAVIVSSGPRSRARRSAASTMSCQARIRVRSECWPVSGRESSWRSPMSAASSVIWAFTEASSALRSAAGSGRPVSSLRERSSMFVRSEVSGVRSSCPASAMSCCCRSREEARDPVMELKERERRAISSSACSSTGMRTARSSVRATCSTASVSRSTGRRPALATASPAAPAPRTPIPETSSRISARSLRVDWVLLSGVATRRAVPGKTCGSVSMLWVTVSGIVRMRTALPSSSVPLRRTTRSAEPASWATRLSAPVTFTMPAEFEETQAVPSAWTSSR